MLNTIRIYRLISVTAFLAVVSGAVIVAVPTSQMQERKAHKIMKVSLNDVLAGWSGKPKATAMKVIQKYGQPNEATASMLIWHNNGPWKRTIIHRDEVPHSFPMPHTDFYEQFIDYRVPVEKYSDLAEYDGSVIVERTKGEISARCDLEEMNFLALNLSHDIVAGKRSVKEARQFYGETAMKFKKGETPPYTRGLQFTVGGAGTADPDQPLQSMGMMSKIGNE